MPTQPPATKEEIIAAFTQAARQIQWKLSHNFNLPEHNYKGPGYVTREDITIKMLMAALALVDDHK